MGFNDVFMRSIEDGFSLLSVGQDKLLVGGTSILKFLLTEASRCFLKLLITAIYYILYIDNILYIDIVVEEYQLIDQCRWNLLFTKYGFILHILLALRKFS